MRAMTNSMDTMIGRVLDVVDSLDPKPPFYKDIVALRRQCETEHKDACDALRFDSDRAMRLDDWQSAAVNLRKLLDTIHNNKDERFKDWLYPVE